MFEKTIATGAVLRDEHDAARDGWLPTARGGLSARLGEGFSLRSAAYLGWRMPTLNELFRPFRAGLDATAANPDLKPERLAGAEAGIDYARGPLRLSLTAFANRLKQAIANVTLGQGPDIFPGVGFVAAGGAYSQRAECRCGEGARDRGFGANGRAVRGACAAGASLTRARMRSERRGCLPRRIAAGANAQVRGDAVGELAIAREGRGAWSCAVSARSSTTTSTATC